MSSTRRYGALVGAAGLASAAWMAACGGATPSHFGDQDSGAPDMDGGPGSPADGSSDASTDGHLHLGSDSGDSGKGPMMDTGAPMGPAIVYAESPGVLYQLDPTTNAITEVAPFSGDCAPLDCKDVIDIALDQNSNGYATTFGSFYSFDPKTAVMKRIARGTYPNSLSFVPKGTLDPTTEALVGYNGSTYIRIDTTTGAITNIGGLTDGLASSGDIVSVIGGGTFLTVKGTEKGTGKACGDCLLQVDPSTGDVIQNYGSVNHASVFGIAFWGGVVYGFDNAGTVFSITFPGGLLTTTDITIAGGGPGQFYGAGSTTAAPPKQSDGGGIPVK